MKNTEIHIVNLIKKQLNKIGMSKAELARRIKLPYHKLLLLFKKKSIPKDLLKKISKVLKIDFMQNNKHLVNPITIQNTQSELLKLQHETEALEQELNYLRGTIEIQQ